MPKYPTRTRRSRAKVKAKAGKRKTTRKLREELKGDKLKKHARRTATESAYGVVGGSLGALAYEKASEKYKGRKKKPKKKK
jgi:hypothetical protein